MPQYPPHFMTRTRNIYRHQCDRAEKDGTAVPYSLAELRTKVAGTASCRYCREPLVVDNVSIDHIEPINRGGTFDLVNTDAICSTCNQRKGDMNRDEYFALIELLDDFHPTARTNVFRRLRAGGRVYYHRK